MKHFGTFVFALCGLCGLLALSSMAYGLGFLGAGAAYWCGRVGAVLVLLLVVGLGGTFLATAWRASKGKVLAPPGAAWQGKGRGRR